CKSECPTNVDMARLKAEALHQHFQAHGLPRRNWLFGHVATLGKWGSRLAPLSSWWMRSRLARWLNEKLLGIDGRRLPPRFARRSFLRQIAGHDLRNPGKAAVVLFPDTFTNFHEPEIGNAAVDVLQSVSDIVVPRDLR